jgi:S-adenosyl methyltransferase
MKVRVTGEERRVVSPGDGGDHAVNQSPGRDASLQAAAVDAYGAIEVSGRVELVQVETPASVTAIPLRTRPRWGDNDGVRDFDTSVPHSARVYDYWLGGKDNFAADRELGERTIQAYPNLVYSVRANRAFLARAVRYLARDERIRQFLDVGTGIPAANNTHEVAQQFAPDSQIVYVDNDPIVLSHARALLTSTPEGKCAYVDADMHDPDAIVAKAAQTLDFSTPVAVMLVAVLQYAGSDAEAGRIVNRLMAACAPGSFLVISHPASDIDPEQVAEIARRFNESGPEQMTRRDHAGVTRFFEGFDLLEPGVTRTAKWRPDSEVEAASPAPVWAGVARKA